MLCRAALCEGRTLVLPVPTFGMIERYAALAGAEVLRVPWGDEAYPVDEVLRRVDGRTGLVAMVSPNNPTGQTASPGDLQKLAATGALVLVDLAYVEFGDAAWTTLYLEVKAPGFDVEEPLKPLRVPRSSDSGVATFVITPRQAGRDSRVVVNLFEDAARQRQLDSLTLMVDIKGPSLGCSSKRSGRS